ncbi:MAG TPA: hypothetical protein VK838_01115 [Candidatus Limnocylindrales bacterium]|nr:hypothetical protein [Candidatus Limnocylindrales bacterium]
MPLPPRSARLGLPLLAAFLAACSVAGTVAPTSSTAASPLPTLTATPSQLPSPSATASPADSDPIDGSSVIVTFRVANDEEYRVMLTDPQDVATARSLLAGEAAPSIPNGRVLPGDGGVNAPWGWHIDPGDFEFAEVTTEVCDGTPSMVEAGTVSGERFCPWSAQVVAVDPVS